MIGLAAACHHNQVHLEDHEDVQVHRKESTVKTLLISIAAAGLSSLFASSALAGPDWNEGGQDAGSTVGSQRAVSSAAGTLPLSSVRGATVTGLVESDFCDLIELEIHDPANFGFLPTADVSYDAQLFLFRGSDWPSGDTAGEPLLCYDDTSATDNRPRFSNATGYWQGNLYLDPMTAAMGTVGEAFTPGHYLIAITSHGFTPYGWDLDGDYQLFNPPATGLGVRIRTNPLHHWVGSATTGTWNFSTTGAQFMPASSCESAEMVYTFGERSIDNTLAGDTASLPDQSCGAVGRDVWFRLAIDCPGSVQIRTCGTINFDSVIEVYVGDSCSSLGFLSCNDNPGMFGTPCPSGSTGSFLQFTDMHCGSPTQYVVRVGSKGTTPGGYGTISFQCIAPPDSPDLNGDGVVNAADLTIMLSSWTGG